MIVDLHTFEVAKGGPHEERKGKTHWPNQLRMEMSEFYAWELVTQLLTQLRYPHNDEPHDLPNVRPITLHMTGTLEHTDTDDI